MIIANLKVAFLNVSSDIYKNDKGEEFPYYQATVIYGIDSEGVDNGSVDLSDYDTEIVSISESLYKALRGGKDFELSVKAPYKKKTKFDCVGVPSKNLKDNSSVWEL